MEAVDRGKSVFLTGHTVFDHIFHVRKGMTVLISDETFSEARSFLNVLLKRHRNWIIYLVTSRHPAMDAQYFAVPLESLQDLSIHVNQKRRSDRGKIFIHMYLPELLIRHNSEEVLKVLELWQKDVVNSETIEFYLLPRNTFEEFERKARAIADAVIDIQVVKQNGRFVYFFTPIRSCAPSYHLKNIQFDIMDSRLLIEWEGVLLEDLPSKIVTADEVRELIEMNGDEVVLRRNDVSMENLGVNDYVLLTTVDGMKVSDLKLIYPDKWEEVAAKVVQLVVGGVLSIERKKPDVTFPKRNRLKFKSRLLLSVPTDVALILVSLFKSFLGVRIRTVPFEAHIAVLDSMRSILNLVFMKNPELRKEAERATRYVGELSARKTALEYITRLEGTPYTKFRVDDVPKLITIALKAGWGLDIKFLSTGMDAWAFELNKCHLCEGVKSDEPFCDKFVSSVVVGVIGVCLKKRVECYEITCKATGADKCSFRVALL
ncbi:MAG: hypothetical protein QXY84_00550 [Candidatus Caldarchaeum sp.]